MFLHQLRYDMMRWVHLDIAQDIVCWTVGSVELVSASAGSPVSKVIALSVFLRTFKLISFDMLSVHDGHLCRPFWARWDHDPLIITWEPFVLSPMLNRTTL